MGNWSGHIPFACDLVSALRPSLLVELGTHLGESYFAFCQAIAESGAPCSAYAIDTWRGDEHTGAYGEEVFTEVDAWNRERYTGFSHLLRTSFEEAAARFEPGTIDLLHIDGLHTYEAVGRDFQTWWPKIKPGGVVLLHDIAMRHADFGVWRLWEELRQSYPVAEFPHSCGLGVVRKPGGTPDAGLMDVLFHGDSHLQDALRRYYELCAERLEYRDLMDRQKQPARWDITTRLFWRGPGEMFAPSASLSAAHTASSRPSRVVLALPAQALPPVELRLDVADGPAYLKLHSISVSDAQGEVLWSVCAGASARELTARGLRALPATDGEGLLVSGAPAESSLLLPLPVSALERLTGGGEIAVELSGLDAWSYSAQSMDSALRRQADDESRLQRTAQALTHAQRLVAERDSHLQVHAAALADAQRIVEEYGAELRKTASAFAEAQRLVSERDLHLQTYAQALGEAQRLVSERDLHLQTYAQTLAEAQRLVSERDLHLQTYAQTLAEAQRLVEERDTQLRDLSAAFEHAQHQVLQRNQELESHRGELTRTQALLADAQERITAQNAEREQLGQEMGRVQDTLVRRERSLDHLARRLEAIESSLAWRLLRPLTGIRPHAKDGPASTEV